MLATRFGISQGLARKEDDALIRGHGRYVADIALPGVLHAVVLRSPHAHARFRVTDVAAARAMHGVHLVLTFADLRPLRGKRVLAGYLYGGIRAFPREFPYRDDSPLYHSGNVPTRSSDMYAASTLYQLGCILKQ